jgi:hypothetical protein
MIIITVRADILDGDILELTNPRAGGVPQGHRKPLDFVLELNK